PRAIDVLQDELGHYDIDIIAVHHSDEMQVDNPSFAAAVERMSEALPQDVVAAHETYLDEDLSDVERGMRVSEDMNSTYTTVTLAGKTHEERLQQFDEAAAVLQTGPLETDLGGPIAVEHELSNTAESDIVRAELITLPLLLLLLVLIFGGLNAGLVALAVCVLVMLGT